MYRSISLIVFLLYPITKINAENGNLVYFKEPKTWLQAMKACSECGGKLVDWDKSVHDTVIENNLQNEIIWIGNFKEEIPWIVEKGCLQEKFLNDASYNIIYNNNPEFCSRTCRTDQMFILKEDNCYCIAYTTLLDLPCNEETHVKVYSFDYVYECDFEKNICPNSNFGEETVGLTWSKATDNQVLQIGNISGYKGYYLLLEDQTATIKNKARFEISLNLTETYFCMSFKYYMNHGGSLEISVSDPNEGSHVIWKKYGNKGHMWYSSSSDIKGHSNLKIEIFGSMEPIDLIFDASTVAIDEIKILSGSCNKEKRLDCSFDNECEWEQVPAWEIFQSTDDNYYLRTAGEKRLYEINSYGINSHISTTFCLQFDYFIQNWKGFLYVYQNNTELIAENCSCSSWIRKWKDIKAKFQYSVKFKWLTNGKGIAIDNISLRSGSCNQDTVPLVDNLKEWENNDNLTVKECGEKCFLFKRSEMKINSVYNLTSPIIKVTSTTIFCLTFHYWSYYWEDRSIKISTLINGRYHVHWENSINYRNNWHQVRIDLKTSDDFKIVLQIVSKNDYYYLDSFKIKMMRLTSGLCYGGTNNASLGPMCPVVDLSDSSRLSVGYCSKMKKQPYICHLHDKHIGDPVCKNGTEIIFNNTELKKASTLLQTDTTLLQTDNISSRFSSITPKKTTVNNLKSTNTPLPLKEFENTRLETGLAVVTSVLSAIVLFLVVLTICLCLKIKRNQSSEKDKANLEKETHNRGYEMEVAETSHIQTTANDADYELASPVKVQPNQRRNNHIDSKDNTHNIPESHYQNCDNLNLKRKRESQVYQDMEEGDYDHLGESARRRKDFEFEGDTLYNHGQKPKLQINGLYDSTKTKTDESYFVLEPQTDAAGESHIYDHTN